MYENFYAVYLPYPLVQSSSGLIQIQIISLVIVLITKVSIGIVSVVVYLNFHPTPNLRVFCSKQLLQPLAKTASHYNSFFFFVIAIRLFTQVYCTVRQPSLFKVHF